MSTTIQTVHLAGRAVQRAYHVCAFFYGKEEEYQVLLPFIREGIDQDQKAVHIISPQNREEHLRRLYGAGIDVAAAQDRRQFELFRWEDAYLKDGYFDQHRMLRMVEEMLTACKEDGWPLTRVVANMEWALEDYPGVDDLVEYEARANLVLPKFDDAVVCTYDLQRFGAEVVMDVLRTHPMVIIGGVLQDNPFFVPAEEFLRELAVRKGAGKAN